MEQPPDDDDLFLIERLGAGGTAEVYRAVRYIDDTHFQELCVKQLQAKLREDPESLFYFRREAAIASDLRHPNIVSLVAIDFARFRIIYELVDGVDLRHVLNHAPDRKLSPDVVTE